MRQVKSIVLTCCFTLLFFSECTVSEINKTLGGILDTPPTTAEVANGLKEALIQGATKGSATASQVGGYLNNPKIKIPFPPDVQKVADKLRQIGLGDQVDRFVSTLNQGAEKAAAEAKPVFVGAIKQMTVQDAWNILKGENDAATQYLQRTTSGLLRARFKPIISSALESTNATKYYGDIVNTYNKIPFVNKVNPDLEDYATDKAMEGLFYLIAQEEANIRQNPGARATDLLKKVFKEQDS